MVAAPRLLDRAVNDSLGAWPNFTLGNIKIVHFLLQIGNELIAQNNTTSRTSRQLAERVGLEPTSRFLHGYGLANRWLTIRRTSPDPKYYILYTIFYPLAITRAYIFPAPFCLRILAHSFNVAPVVQTSSTSTISLSLKFWPMYLNFPTTLASLASFSLISAWGLLDCFKSRLASKSNCAARPISWARSFDWLNPRQFNRRWLRGTGTKRGLL